MTTTTTDHDGCERKLAELVLYVATRCQTDHLYGKVKLNKILFYSDFNAFSRLGRSVTGATYAKRLFGPVPKRMEAVVEQLVEDKAAGIQVVPMPDRREQHRVIALRKPDLEPFSGQEIAIVDEMIEWIRPMSAIEISELSHETAAWRLSHMDEDIPYGTALIPDRPLPLTASEIEFGRGVARRYARTSASAG